METRRPTASSLATMVKPSTSRSGSASQRSSRISAAGGGEASRRAWNAVRAASEPQASMVTPAESLRTVPAMPSSRARR